MIHPETGHECAKTKNYTGSWVLLALTLSPEITKNNNNV